MCDREHDPAKAIGPDGRTYQQYLDERKLLLEHERAAADNFDKMLLSLSAGSIALSVTFLEKIGSAGAAKPILYAAWLILVAGLIVNLRSFMVLQTSINRVIEINDVMFETGAVEMSNPHQPQIRVFNRWAFGLFVLGITLLLTFAALNFRAAKPSTSNTISDLDNMVIDMTDQNKTKVTFTLRRASDGPSPAKRPPATKPQNSTTSTSAGKGKGGHNGKK
jgi:hypothetical protein